MDIEVEVWDPEFRRDFKCTNLSVAWGKGWERLGSMYRMRRRELFGQNPENLQQVEKKLANKKEWPEKYWKN